MHKDKITVLLAAFNGEKYIEKQIYSIISSKIQSDIHVIIGLEPSEDQTDLLLKKFESPSIVVVRNPTPSGSAKNNFSSLAEHALKTDGNYFSFSDQDDDWDDDKLALTYNKLREMECQYGNRTPLLVFSDSRLVTAELRVIASSFMANESLSPDAAQNFKQLIIQNVGQGCTFIFNRALLEIATPIPCAARFHDHWFLLVACAFGKIDFIQKPLLSYRQHSSNVLGSKGTDLFNSIYRVARKAESIRTAITELQSQAKAFSVCYGTQVAPEIKKYLDDFADLRERGFLFRKIFCLKHGLKMSNSTRTAGLYLFI